MPSELKVTAKGNESKSLSTCVKLFAFLLLGPVAAPAQAAPHQSADGLHSRGPVIAITYDLERAKVSTLGSGFWLQGGGVDVAVPFYQGFGVAGSFQGGHVSNIQPGVSLGKLSYLAGPRYTLSYPHTQIFGEGLFGSTHGFDGIFPGNGGVTSSANSFAVQFGGGLDFALSNGLGLRAFEIDYVRTALPNNGTNTQKDVRLAFGLSYRFTKK